MSYCFVVAWNTDALGARARELLAGYERRPNSRITRRPEAVDQRCYGLAQLPYEDSEWFWVVEDGVPVFGLPDAGPTLDWFTWKLNGDLVRYARDFFIIHAGAVVAPCGGAVVLPARSGGGKSSLVAGLVQDGFGYLSDEFAAIDPIDRQLYAVPRAISLKPGSYRLLDGVHPPDTGTDPLMGKQWHLDRRVLGPYGGDGPHRVEWIVAPEYQHGAPLTLTPMSTAETAFTLGSHSPGLWVYGHRSLPLLVALAQGAVGVHMISSDLRAAVAAIRSLVSGTPVAALRDH